MMLGSTASQSGALGLSYDFTAKVVVTPDISLGGMTLYSNILPGIEWLQEDQASPPLYALKVGTPFSLEIVALDPGASMMVGDTTLDTPGESAFVANTTNVAGDHFHPQWQLLLADGVTGDYALSFRITTTAKAYTASATYTLVITNIADATATPTDTLAPTASPTATPVQIDTLTPSLPTATDTATPPSTASPTVTPPAVATDSPTAIDTETPTAAATSPVPDTPTPPATRPARLRVRQPAPATATATARSPSTS